MKYNLENYEDRKHAMEYLDKLISKNAIVEIKQKHHQRSLIQNNYLYLLLGYTAIEIGEELEYFKQEYFKKIICPEIFRTDYKNKKTGKNREDWKSTADLTTKELTLCIERLKKWASTELGLYLPDANDFDSIIKLENTIENSKQYF